MPPRRQVDRNRLGARVEAAGPLRKHRPDYGLVIISALLMAIGLIVVYSISPALSKVANVSTGYFVNKQLIVLALSIIAFLITAHVPLELFRRYYKLLLAAAGIATLIALLTPTDPLYPAHRWVRFGGFSLQSVELLKFAVLITAAGFFAERIRSGTLGDRDKTLKPLLIAVTVLGVVVAGPQVLHAQSDLGSMGVIVAILGTMAFVAGMPLKPLIMGAAVLAVMVVLVVLPSAYRRERVTAFLHPEANCQSTGGYQACQALIAVGSGGLAGLGLGRSVQAYGYLPEAANDSIFAIFAEKFGFLGTAALLGLLAAFFGRLKSIAERAPDHFSRLLVSGVLAWLSVQAMINIGAMIGLLPLKGITLPLISYGGTSVVFVAAAIGLAFQVSYYTAFSAPRIANTNKGIDYDDSRNGRRLRGAYHPNPGSRARA